MYLRRMAILIVVILLMCRGDIALPQIPPLNLPPQGGYHPLPNFSGVDAGRDFRDALNDRFSGNQPISPKIVSLPFASLAAEQDGLVVYCNDCKRSLPCSPGGSGALAIGVNGQYECNTPLADLKLDGTDNLGSFNGARTNEKNILDFGAIASTTTVSCTTAAGQSTISCPGITGTDFKRGQYVALYGAGPGPSVAQPTGMIVQPTTTTNNISAATHFTRFAQGCTVQNAVAWCRAGSNSCAVSNVSFYEIGNAISIAGAGPGGAALAATIVSLDDTADTITLNVAAALNVSGAAITGANCTTSRSYQVFPIDSKGGFGSPTTTMTVNNTASALNWQNWVDVQVNVPQPPNAPNPSYPLPSNIPIAWAFYCAEGSNPLQLCGVEVPTYSYEFNSTFPAPWNDSLIGGSTKGFPTVVTFHDVGRPYGHDIVQGTAEPSGQVNQITFAKILSIAGNNVQLSVAPAQSSTVPMGHDNGPAINAAILASCTASERCGTVYTPWSSSSYPVASGVIAQHGVGLNLLGANAGVPGEPNGGARGSAWTWTGALGGTMLTLNQQMKPVIQSMTFGAENGTTMGVSIDVDGYDPGDGLGFHETTTQPTFRDVVTGQASVGGRFANINGGNVEFGVFEGDVFNVVGASASAIGVLINSVNALGFRFGSTDFGGMIGVWDNLAGLYAVQSQEAAPDSIAFWLAGGYGHPTVIEASRDEHLFRLLYSPFIGGSGDGMEVTIKGVTTADMRLPGDCGFIALGGAKSTILQGNDFLTPALGTNGDYTTAVCPNGFVLPGQNASIESHGNYWSTVCGDPFGLAGGDVVNLSGDECTGPSGFNQPLREYVERVGGAGFSIGSASGGPQGAGTLNVQNGIYDGGHQISDNGVFTSRVAKPLIVWTVPARRMHASVSTLAGTFIWEGAALASFMLMRNSISAV